MPSQAAGGGATWRDVLSWPFAAAGVAHASSFALRQGGRNLLLALVAVDTFGYSPKSLGLLFGGMALVDLAAVGPTSRRADAVSDARVVVVPAILGAAAACAWVGAVASVARHDGDPDGSLHSLFLAGVAAWSVATASLGPTLPAYAAHLAPEGRRGIATALFRSCGDVGFVLTPVALGALADVTSPPAAMVALGGGAATAGLAFAALGTPHRS